MNNQVEAWNASYDNRENHLFYPAEEIIRFVAKYLRKRTGISEFRDIRSFDPQPKFLDLGCGIGRHVQFAEQTGFDAYGIDLSRSAVETAIKWASGTGMKDAEKRFAVGDVRKLPWPDQYFDTVVSSGVLDSMHFEIAVTAIAETARVMTRGGLFLCSLISGDNRGHSREYCGEELVSGSYENGTIQSYYNFAKIEKLTASHFKIEDCVLVRRESVLTGDFHGRYYVTLKKL